MTADVSVVIPVHNGARYLAAAIESVLEQRPRPREVLVIDDGSTDRSARVAERFAGVRCLRQPNRGLGATHNRGVAVARGELVGFLDQDDLWHPGKLERQLAAYGLDDRLDVVFGHVRQFVSPELDARSAAALRCPPRAEPGYLIGSGLFRRRSLARIGPFRETSSPATSSTGWLARETAACARRCSPRSSFGAAFTRPTTGAFGATRAVTTRGCSRPRSIGGGGSPRAHPDRG